MNNKNIIKTAILVLLVVCQVVLPAEEKKFKIEIGGNYFFADPQHMNFLPEVQNLVFQLYFDPIYEAKEDEGSLTAIKSFISLHTRVKYALTPAVDLSVGFSYLWHNHVNEYSVTYTRQESWRTLVDKLEFPEMATEIKAFIPSIGIHYHLPLFKKTNVVFSVTGGPVFADISHSNQVNQSITSMSNSTFPFWSTKKSTTMTGQGIGISLSGSVRLEQAFSKSLGMALEGGYSWQEVSGIEGDGSETIDGLNRAFNGKWGLVKEDITIPWGTATFWFPTNDWAQFGQESGKFILDLSGFYASVGFYIRL